MDVDLEFGVTDQGATWRLTIRDDSLALEYNDALDLVFTSAIGEGSFSAANPRQYVRTSMHIRIVDTDGEATRVVLCGALHEI